MAEAIIDVGVLFIGFALYILIGETVVEKLGDFILKVWKKI